MTSIDPQVPAPDRGIPVAPSAGASSAVPVSSSAPAPALPPATETPGAGSPPPPAAPSRAGEPKARPEASCLERVFDAGLLAFHGLGLFTVVVAVSTASPDPEVAPAFILAASAVISLGAAASLHRRWGHVGLGEVRYLLIGGLIWMAMAAASLYDPTVTAGTGLALLALASSLTSVDVGSTGSGGLSCGCFMMILLLVLQRLAHLLPPD